MGQVANFCTPVFEPGRSFTAQTTAAVTGKRFVKISAVPLSGPAVSDAVDGGNFRVAHAGAGEMAIGVSEYDAASGAKVGVIRKGAIVPMTAGAAITFGQEVQSDANGKAIPLAAGKSLGVAMNSQAVVDSDIIVALN